MKLKGLIVGLLAGTAVGLFFAPKPGKEMREKIKKERATGGTGIAEFSKAAVATAGSFFEYLKEVAGKAEELVQGEFLDTDDEDSDSEEKKSTKKKR